MANDKMLVLNLEMFVEDMVDAGRRWRLSVLQDPVYQANWRAAMKVRRNGLPPLDRRLSRSGLRHPGARRNRHHGPGRRRLGTVRRSREPVGQQRQRPDGALAPTRPAYGALLRIPVG